MRTERAELNPTSSLPAIPGLVDVLAALLAGRNLRTLRAYDKDLTDFVRYLGQADARAAIEVLVSLAHGQANAAIRQWGQVRQ